MKYYLKKCLLLSLGIYLKIKVLQTDKIIYLVELLHEYYWKLVLSQCRIVFLNIGALTPLLYNRTFKNDEISILTCQWSDIALVQISGTIALSCLWLHSIWNSFLLYNKGIFFKSCIVQICCFNIQRTRYQPDATLNRFRTFLYIIIQCHP